MGTREQESRSLFEDFEFEPSSGFLRRGEVVTRLRNQSAKALELLLEEAGSVVSRRELRLRIWGEQTYVDFEQGINSCIRELRIALGDDASVPKFIETLPGRGYRFLVSVRRVDPADGDGGPVPDSGAMEAAGSGDELEVLPIGAAGGSGRASRHVGSIVALLLGIAAVAVATAVLLGRGGSGEPEASPSEPRTARALLVGFDNQTGDPMLDDSLEVVFRIGLERHRSLRLVTTNEVRLSLGRMHRPLDTVLDRELALEVAQRLNARFLIEGKAFGLGSRYLLAVEVLDPTTGGTVHAAKREAADRGELVGVLDHLIEGIVDEVVDRRGQTEARGASPPLAQVTTGNLEALKAYSIAQREIDAGRLAEARYSLLRAIELDPDFAMAHARLGVVFRNSMDPDQSRFHFEQARRLKDRLTAFEALYVEAWLATSRPDPGHCLELWSQMAQEFPESSVGHYNLAMARYTIFGDFSGCVKAMDKVLELGLGGVNERYAHLYRAACLQGLDEEERAMRDVRAVLEQEDLDPAAMQEALWRLLALGEIDEVEERLPLRGTIGESPPVRIWDFQLYAALALEHDRPAESLELLGRGADLARSSGLDSWELEMLINRAALAWADGIEPELRERALEAIWSRAEVLLFDRSLDYPSLQLRSLALLGAACARVGELDRARRLRDRFVVVRAEVGVGGLWQGDLDILDSELELRLGRFAEAARILERSVLQVPAPPYHARETLARAYLDRGDREGAHKLYRWLAAHRNQGRVESIDGTLDYYLNRSAYETAVGVLGADGMR